MRNLPHWYDVVDKAAASIGGAAGIGKFIEDVLSEVSMKNFSGKGYVIFDMERDMYMIDNTGDVGWDTDKFTVLSGDEIGSIQDILLHTEDKMEAFWAISYFHAIEDKIDSILVVPCVVTSEQSEKITFDFVNAFKFDEAKKL